MATEILVGFSQSKMQFDPIFDAERRAVCSQPLKSGKTRVVFFETGNLTQVAMVLRVSRRETDRFLQSGFCFRQSADCAQREAEVVVGLDKVRFQGGCPAKRLDRFLGLVGLEQRPAQVSVSVRVVGPDADRRVMGGDGVVKSALRAKHHAEIGVSFRMVRRQTYRLVAGGGRLIELALREERQAEIGIRVRVARS